MKTLYAREMVRRCALNYPNKTAYLCGTRSATWAQMHERSDRFAKVLQDRGIRRGDTISILSQEAIEVYEHMLASLKLGTTRVGVNTLYAWPEMKHVLTDSRTKVLMVDARVRKLIDERRADLDALGILVIGYNGDHGCALDYETLMAAVQGAPVLEDLHDDDLALISYTSGTTGVPKGVMIKQVGVSIVLVHCIASFGFSPDDVWYMPAASAWVVILMVLFGLANGMTAVIPDGGFNLQAYLRDVERHRVTITLLVPTMLQRVLAEIQRDTYDLSSLRAVMYGSSPATPKLIRDAREALGVDLIQTYGQTESSGGWVTVLTEADHKLGLSTNPEILKSVGRIGQHVECTIRDEDGKVLPPNTRGEIWLRGECMMAGYLNLPEATAEALLPDGWMRTNDIGKMDERGYLYLLDRQKFMIITGAVNVFPTTVEAVIAEHPALQEVAVVGIPHPEWGEAVVAVAVLRPGFESTTAQDVIRFCDGHLSKPETPKHVVFVQDMMRTVNGKLRKNDMKAWLMKPESAHLIPWSTKVE